MPKCPKCNEKIDSLNYVVAGLMTYQKGEWLEDGDPDAEYTCVNCGEKVTPDTLIYEE